MAINPASVTYEKTRNSYITYAESTNAFTNILKTSVTVLKVLVNPLSNRGRHAEQLARQGGDGADKRVHIRKPQRRGADGLSGRVRACTRRSSAARTVDRTSPPDRPAHESPGRPRTTSCAMLADTSSAAAGITATVGAAAAMWAALSVEPIAATSVAAAAIISGAAVTLDTSILPPGRHRPSGKATA